MTREIKNPEKHNRERNANQQIEQSRKHSGPGHARDFTRGEPHGGKKSPSPKGETKTRF